MLLHSTKIAQEQGFSIWEPWYLLLRPRNIRHACTHQIVGRINAKPQHTFSPWPTRTVLSVVSIQFFPRPSIKKVLHQNLHKSESKKSECICLFLPNELFTPLPPSNPYFPALVVCLRIDRKAPGNPVGLYRKKVYNTFLFVGSFIPRTSTIVRERL